MSNIGRILAKEMAKSGDVKIIPGKSIGNISPVIEWIKWLSYEPEFEIKRMENLNSKKASLLSYGELEEIIRYRRNNIFARLFKLFELNECSEEEYMKVYDYMHNESIEELMLSKLTSLELQYAKQEIIRLSKISKTELSAKIRKEQKPEEYKKLSMVDAYILHLISDVNYARNMVDLDREIDAQIKQNEAMRQRSLYYAANPYKK